jgi:putative ABC transport system permease protein
MTGFLTELRHAARGLVRRPGFTLIVAFTLALGLGANTAIFSAVYELMLKPLPYAAGDRMAWVWWSAETGGMSISPRLPLIEAWQAQELRTVESVEPFTGSEVTLLGDAGPEIVHVTAMTGTLPATLGTPLVLGRSFERAELIPGGPGAVILSEGFWRRRLGGASDVLGRTLRFDGGDRTVVGVAADAMAAFRGRDQPTDVWLPLVVDSTLSYANVLVVLREGVTEAAAEAELTAVASGVNVRAPTADKWVPRLMTAGDLLGDRMRDALFVLVAAVGAVLLIACANVAGLLVVRTVGRSREIAIRAALGARTQRLLGTVGAEAALLALLGGVLGILLGAWLMDLARLVRPPELIALAAISLDPVVLAYAGGLCVLTALLFGIAPAALVVRHDLADVLKATGGGSAGAAFGERARSLLVGGQIAISVVLLVGAGLLLRTVADLQGRDLGFRPAGLLTASVPLPEARYPEGAAQRVFTEELLARVRAIPDVESAATGSGLPPEFGMVFSRFVDGEGRPVPDRGGATAGAWVDADFFTTLGIPLVEGRSFDPDQAGSEIIVNQSVARRLWPNESAIGKRITTEGSEEAGDVVVGVAGDVRVFGPTSDPDETQLYFPTTYSFGVQIVVRSRSGAPLDLVPAIRAALAEIDPTLPLRNVDTVEDRLANSIAQERFTMSLLGGFAVLALLLSAVGLYGVISHSVARRSREIGIRMALGAEPGAVRRLVLAQGARVTLVGALFGLAAAFAAARLLDNLLHGLRPYDPLTFATAVVVATLTAILATALPARRATRVDPVHALRSE